MKKNIVNWGLVCFLTYLTAYLCRVNFSASLTTLSESLSLDYNLLGTAGAAFFAVYAVGQLINGFLGDHFHPVRFVMIALIGTALCNIGVGFAGSYALILTLWAANGYFQSIFWSTIIRLLSMVTDEKGRAGASALISAAMPAGYLISWCVLAPCFGGTNAMLFFLVPAAVALGMLGLWVGKSEYLPQTGTAAVAASALKNSVGDTLKLIAGEGLALVPVALVFHGLIKEGIAFWIPTIIREASGSAWLTALMLALLPAANFAGTMAAKRLLKIWHNTPFRVVLLGMLGMLPLSALCLLPLGVWALIPMCLMSCLSYCMNTVMLSFVPMAYQKYGKVSSIVGVFDFSSYMGAALSTYVLGGIITEYGVQGMAVIWVAAACVGAAVIAVKMKLSAKQI